MALSRVTQSSSHQVVQLAPRLLTVLWYMQAFLLDRAEIGTFYSKIDSSVSKLR